MKKIPKQFAGRIGYGLYGGVDQFYIIGVDGTVAQLGSKLPGADELEREIVVAKRAHKKLLQNRK